MSKDRETQVLDMIYQALRTLNEERGPDEQIDIQLDTALFGKNSALDSLALVSVIVDIETVVSDHFERHISLTDDAAMSRDPVPFSSVMVLKNYILELVA